MLLFVFRKNKESFSLICVSDVFLLCLLRRRANLCFEDNLHCLRLMRLKAYGRFLFFPSTITSALQLDHISVISLRTKSC